MTDMTTHAPVSPDLRASHRRSPPRGEYQVYFALIFAVALPGAALGWTRDALTGEAGKGPVARALSHAHTITPQIFRA